MLEAASQIYAYAFFGTMLGVSVLEWLAPRRELGDNQGRRWLSNVAITVLDVVVVRSLFPLVGVGWAVYVNQRHWGVFNGFACPPWIAFIVTVVALDAMSYTQHRLLHGVPVLWRLHRTHHTDVEYDFTTGLRFHPLEAVFTASIFLGTIAALGAPPAALLVSQLLAGIITLTEHANVQLSPAVDRIMRLVVVTPNMHRVHHSSDRRESQANFAGSFPWWDRMFGTYLEQPTAGDRGMVFGVVGFEDRKHLALPWMLADPFLHAPEPDRARATPSHLPAALVHAIPPAPPTDLV